jgi:hypothetical protein
MTWSATFQQGDIRSDGSVSTRLGPGQTELRAWEPGQLGLASVIPKTSGARCTMWETISGNRRPACVSESMDDTGSEAPLEMRPTSWPARRAHRDTGTLPEGADLRGRFDDQSRWHHHVVHLTIAQGPWNCERHVFVDVVPPPGSGSIVTPVNGKSEWSRQCWSS